jgi:hypothetical protein
MVKCIKFGELPRKVLYRGIEGIIRAARRASEKAYISYSPSTRSVTNICPGLWVIIKAGLACLAAA